MAAKDTQAPTVAETATNANAPAENAPAEKVAGKLGTVTIDTSDKDAFGSADERVVAAVKAIQADKVPEGVTKTVWDIHNPTVYTLTFED